MALAPNGLMNGSEKGKFERIEALLLVLLAVHGRSLLNFLEYEFLGGVVDIGIFCGSLGFNPHSHILSSFSQIYAPNLVSPPLKA